MINLEFYKISANGNDFIVIDNRKNIFNADIQSDLISKMTLRHYAIGSDGVCFIENSKKADYCARFFSIDGKEQSFFTNGLRSAVRVANEKEIAGTKQTIETKVGILSAEIDNEIISVECPDALKLELRHGISIPHEYDNKIIELSYVDFATKHLVIKVEKIENVNYKKIGKILSQCAKHQPDGVNVSFYELVDNHNIKVVTYEYDSSRIIESSGDGVYASFLIAEAKKEIFLPILAYTFGGTMMLERKNQTLFIKGEARVAFIGNVSSNMLSFNYATLDKIQKKDNA